MSDKMAKMIWEYPTELQAQLRQKALDEIQKKTFVLEEKLRQLDEKTKTPEE